MLALHSVYLAARSELATCVAHQYSIVKDLPDLKNSGFNRPSSHPTTNGSIPISSGVSHHRVRLPSSQAGVRNLVGLGRLELPTSPLSGVRSSHLSYRPADFSHAALPCFSGQSGFKLAASGRFLSPEQLQAGCVGQLLSPEQLQAWWSWSGSNRRPPECKSGALPAELQPHSFSGGFSGQAETALKGKLSRPIGRRRPAHGPTGKVSPSNSKWRSETNSDWKGCHLLTAQRLADC